MLPPPPHSSVYLSLVFTSQPSPFNWCLHNANTRYMYQYCSGNVNTCYFTRLSARLLKRSVAIFDSRAFHFVRHCHKQSEICVNMISHRLYNTDNCKYMKHHRYYMKITKHAQLQFNGIVSMLKLPSLSDVFAFSCTIHIAFTLWNTTNIQWIPKSIQLWIIQC